MKVLLKYLLVSLLISCSPQKKLNNLLKRHPELLQQDTLNLFIHDTVVIERFHHDTVTRVSFHDTTIIVNNERILAKYFYDTLRKEIHHYIECKGDTVTIIKEVLVPYNKVEVKELTWWQKYRDIIIIIATLLLGLVIFKKVGKFFL